MNVLRLFQSPAPLLSLVTAGFTSCSSIVAPPQSRSVSTLTHENTTSLDHRTLEKRTSSLLQRVVDDKSLVDYQSLIQEPEELSTLYTAYAERSPDSHPESFPDSDAAFAYWLNAYNVTTLYGVVEASPIESVRDHKPLSVFSLINGGGFFAAQKFRYGKKAYSLYEVENEIIRKRYPDPRLHFALNCASTSCPDLLNVAYQASSLDRQLDIQTRRFMALDKALLVDDANQTIAISAIFDWYASDFLDHLKTQGDSEPEILDYISPYLGSKRAKALRKARAQNYRLIYQDYDWSLNRQK